MLPAHPQPLPDEILSSWMVRLAFENGYSIHTFYANLLRCKLPIWTRDIDRHPHPAILALLERQTGQSVEALRLRTLQCYEGLIYDVLPQFGNAAWVRPAGVFHRDRRRAGMQFCPACLADDRVPYFRLRWRLAFYGLCHIHGTCMLDCCPWCGSPVMFHRHGIGRDRVIPHATLCLCSVCNADLREAPVAPPTWQDHASLQRYIDVCQLFSHRHWDCGEFTPGCSISFFHGLRVLLAALSGRFGIRIRPYLADLGIELNGMMGLPKVDYEYYRTAEQRQLMLTVMWLLEGWPARFLDVCYARQLTRSRLTSIEPELPYWLYRVAADYLDQRQYWPCEQELRAAAPYLERR
ncbi:TniQ family protein [Chitiniphilus eburneus]|uniref:TniQ domain-containing protein n=1 Tax=Chitiniphilus eburneus TaxID=2571148 RepID=A0A4U0Q8E1_9NEIS|nr:TniQ family protein [Chitiniphilus eburneus]TJZ77527.1 hypothetical protein FAZ21_04125 [Chitiniphilus eburneus]